MKSTTKSLSIVLVSLIVIFSQSCNKESDQLLLIKNTLTGSWYTYDYKHDSEEWTDFPEENSPYIILNEYGSGFDLDENQYFTHYSESFPTGGGFRGKWKLKDKNTLEFTSSNQGIPPKVFEVEIIEIEENFLWIHDHGVEYKLKRIE